MFISRASVLSRSGNLSLNYAQAKLAICTWCPFIFRRPICKDTWHSPGPGSKCWQRPRRSQRGRGKTPSSVKLFLPLFPTFLWSAEPKQQLLTPDAQNLGRTTFCRVGGQDRIHVTKKLYKRSSPASRLFQVLVPSPPHHHHIVSPEAPLSCPTSLLCFCFLSVVDGAWEYLLFLVVNSSFRNSRSAHVAATEIFKLVSKKS